MSLYKWALAVFLVSVVVGSSLVSILGALGLLASAVLLVLAVMNSVKHRGDPKPAKTKSPIYMRSWVWVLCAVLAVGVLNMGGSNDSSTSDAGDSAPVAEAAEESDTEPDSNAEAAAKSKTASEARQQADAEKQAQEETAEASSRFYAPSPSGMLTAFNNLWPNEDATKEPYTTSRGKTLDDQWTVTAGDVKFTLRSASSISGGTEIVFLSYEGTADDATNREALICLSLAMDSTLTEDEARSFWTDSTKTSLDELGHIHFTTLSQVEGGRVSQVQMSVVDDTDA